ncbi:helix-turn-helix transcriptional regulator [Pseudozobellia thermophila]|uniref:Helix-turn-helix domain-containing protein n=1 Tax=Pseudozobellia thermophila TaxID=192903 RepID=A0A1M6D6K7_9FLAO|nr:helix-turn-helix transcriptional regulator [Pseudozobellia thermophila]SHI68839.1 Helix-turn-helix domain-containing protein [Pseudozobellia thermophila]
MEIVIHVKNMVCDRCKMVVSQSVKDLGLTLVKVELGAVTLGADPAPDYRLLGQALEAKGFELILDKNQVLVEEMKSTLIDFVDPNGRRQEENLSSFLSKKLNKDYSVLSKLFSKTEGISVEKYVINLKIERAKELIQMNDLSFSQIAYTLGYKSSSHLARQFKAVTGLSMSAYKESEDWQRKPLDRIV